MNFKELVSKTRTVHRYDETKSVDPQIIFEALEVSLMAPNHKFTFPWKYYWPKEQTRKEFVEVVAKLKGGGKPEKEEATRKTFSSMSEIIFFVQKLAKDDFTIKEDYATLSASVQLFALSLAAHNVSYKWSTSSVMNDESVYKILGIDQNEEEIIGMIFVGHPEGELPSRRRPNLESVLVRN